MIEQRDGGDGVVTSPTLLSGLRRSKGDDRFESSWRRFCDVYTPMLYSWCRRRALSHNDAEDVVAGLMMKLAKALQEFAYDDKRSFRAWLRVATERAIVSFWRDAKPELLVDWHKLDEQQLPEALLEKLNRQFDRELEAEARRIVRSQVVDRDWRIFELLTETPAKPDEVATQFAIKRGAVDQVKYKITTLLREQIEMLNESGISEYGA